MNSYVTIQKETEELLTWAIQVLSGSSAPATTTSPSSHLDDKALPTLGSLENNAEELRCLMIEKMRDLKKLITIWAESKPTNWPEIHRHSQKMRHAAFKDSFSALSAVFNHVKKMDAMRTGRGYEDSRLFMKCNQMLDDALLEVRSYLMPITPEGIQRYQELREEMSLTDAQSIACMQTLQYLISKGKGHVPLEEVLLDEFNPTEKLQYEKAVRMLLIRQQGVYVLEILEKIVRVVRLQLLEKQGYLQGGNSLGSIFAELIVSHKKHQLLFAHGAREALAGKVGPFVKELQKLLPYSGNLKEEHYFKAMKLVAQLNRYLTQLKTQLKLIHKPDSVVLPEMTEEEFDSHMQQVINGEERLGLEIPEAELASAYLQDACDQLSLADQLALLEESAATTPSSTTPASTSSSSSSSYEDALRLSAASVTTASGATTGHSETKEEKRSSPVPLPPRVEPVPGLEVVASSFMPTTTTSSSSSLVPTTAVAPTLGHKRSRSGGEHSLFESSASTESSSSVKRSRSSHR